MKQTDKKYGLFTAVTMIIGVCIGSGIFFKSDNILIATNGNILLGVFLFVLAALAIIFGSLTIGQLASRSENPGGLITYAEDFIGEKMAARFGWFQLFMSYPAIIVVVAAVVGVYINILFHLEASLEVEMLLGFGFLSLCFLYNTFSPWFGKFFQNSSTIVKIIPLALLGLLGMIYGDPIAGLTSMSFQDIATLSWISALGPIAYSYDGWIVSTSIAHEVKDSKKTLPRALTIAPILILLIYVTYFVGISSYIGPETVMQLGDRHVSEAARQLLGTPFSKAITVFVIISVMGTVNGLVTGYIRIPYSLAIRKNMIPFSSYLKKMNDRHQIPIHSSLCAYGICTLWYVIHYFTSKFGLLPNSDVSEISIAISYLLYIILYYKVYELYRKKEITSRFKGIICPILGTMGSLIILSGAIQNPLFIFYFILCAIILYLGGNYYQRHAL